MAAKGVVAAMAWLGLTLSGCVVTHPNLASSADRLERTSLTLAESTRAGPSSSDARALADQAHDFRETLEDRRVDDRAVRSSFERLSHRYHDLRDEVDRSESRAAQADLVPVTQAYLDVEREMGGYLDHHRYAGEGARSDRD